MRPRAAEDPMQNTWSIGRTWKPREGWSRPVLTDERQHQHSNPWRLDRIFLLQTTPDGNEHCLATRRNINGIASPIRFPGRHKAGRPQRLTVQEKICGGHGPGETPGPIPNPEAKAWHGDGTAPDRVWESSTPPHHTYRKPLGAHAPRGFRIPETLTTQTHTPPQKHPGLLALMRPTSGTIPGQPRRRGRTTRRVRDRGSPTPEPPYP